MQAGMGFPPVDRNLHSIQTPGRLGKFLKKHSAVSKTFHRQGRNRTGIWYLVFGCKLITPFAGPDCIGLQGKTKYQVLNTKYLFSKAWQERGNRLILYGN
jgi:hypothetical protein